MKSYLKVSKHPQYWVLFTVLFFMTTALQSSAQTIERLEEKIAVQSADAQRLNNLTTGVHASVYIENGSIKSFGNGPVVIANVAPGDFSVMYNENPVFGSIELLKINISNQAELQNRLNLEEMQGFENLSFIIVTFMYDTCGNNSENCIPALVENLIPGLSDNLVTVCYKLSIPN